MLAIIVSLILIVVLLVGVLMGGVRVNITNPNNDTNDTICCNEKFIHLNNVYIQIIHINSIEIDYNNRNIEILTDAHRYSHKYEDSERFYETLQHFDFILGTYFCNYDIQTCNESSRD